MTQPITTTAREKAIQIAVEAAKEAVANGSGTAEEVRWKDEKLILPVASIDLDIVLLSPHSHRIKAQLQSLPQAQQDVVAANPFGAQAQELIARLLRETPGYERIKNALMNDGQLFPGVLTTAGVLVNANTRVVALRDLRKKYIKVVVLPPDAGTKEITELELRLQMEQEIKQDYSFTSQLLFIEDLINSNNYTTLDVGRSLRPALTTSKRDTKIATDLVEGELRLLGLIREVTNGSGGEINFLYFDDKRQALVEIDQDYQRLKSIDPDEAVRVRDAQLAGMIAGVDYRRLREIDSMLLNNYVAPALKETKNLAPHADVLLTPTEAIPSNTDSPAGVSDFFGDDEDASFGEDISSDEDDVPAAGPSLSRVYTLLAQTKPEGEVTISSSDGQDVNLSRVVVSTELFTSLTTAIENKKRDSKQVDNLTAPMIHLKEAARVLDKATKTYTEVHGRPEFDESAFNAAVQEYERAAAEFSTITSAAEDTDV